MPVRKKKSGKRKKKSASPARPKSGVKDAGSKTGKKRKKSAKKKLTKAEKAAEKLQKSVNRFIDDLDRHNNFIARMDKWILENADKAIEMFRSYNDVETVTYEEFKGGMFDLNAPCNNLELQILALRLDRRKTGNIDYLELKKGLRFYRDDETDDDGEDEDEEEEEEGEEVAEKKDIDEKEEQNQEGEETLALEKAKQLILFGSAPTEGSEEQSEADKGETIKLEITREELEKCSCCKLSLWQPYRIMAPKYVLLELRLITFDNVRSYPGHFKKLVHSHLTIYGIMQIIYEETATESSKLKIFQDKTRNTEALLMPDVTLEEIGAKGGVYQDPEPMVLYYDYTTEFHDCPLLMSDYYFV
ncbi:uncharacterized protein LOC100371068 [Saccoglossus kowalevskii]|uniref:Resistance to inhibitors of cholinesterase protein 3-like n=1 Tax=Saccoglossus kowalevskii TaxID=10224 RepID=A0ABM0GTJ6_SACKO|nr:PREDICTED: resistance to inhibitors of cholinesterase protein 3-like [Saccoglossus kowalevskii]